MSRNRMRRSLVVIAGAIVFTSACQPPEARIALAYNPPAASDTANLGVLAQAMVDSIYGRGRPRIVIVTKPSVTSEAHVVNQDLSDAVNYAVRFSREPYLAGFIGPEASSNALITAPILNEAGIPQIVPTATSRILRTAGRFTFQMAPDDSVEGEFIAEYIATRLAAGTATIFYLTEEYGTGLRHSVRSALAARSIAILDEVPIRTDGKCPPLQAENSYQDVVAASLLRGVPDAVVVAGRILETGCIAAILHERIPDVPIVAGDGTVLGQRFAGLAGAGATSVHAVSFWDPHSDDPAVRSFVHRFRAVVGRPPHHGDALAYDATMLLAQAIRAVGANRERIRNYLAGVGTDRPPFAGITGPIVLAPGRHHRLLMTRIGADGAISVVGRR